MDKRLIFRQVIKPEFRKFNGFWHNWGYVDGGFISPMGANTGGDSYESTGLIDTNKSLIYRNDFVVIPEFTDRGDGTYDDTLCLVFYDGGTYLVGDISDPSTVDYLHEHFGQCTVVGNSIEHPNLLNEVNQ